MGKLVHIFASACYVRVPVVTRLWRLWSTMCVQMSLISACIKSIHLEFSVLSLHELMYVQLCFVLGQMWVWLICLALPPPLSHTLTHSHSVPPWSRCSVFIAAAQRFLAKRATAPPSHFFSTRCSETHLAQGGAEEWWCSHIHTDINIHNVVSPWPQL